MALGNCIENFHNLHVLGAAWHDVVGFNTEVRAMVLWLQKCLSAETRPDIPKSVLPRLA